MNNIGVNNMVDEEEFSEITLEEKSIYDGMDPGDLVSKWYSYKTEHTGISAKLDGIEEEMNKIANHLSTTFDISLPVFIDNVPVKPQQQIIAPIQQQQVEVDSNGTVIVAPSTFVANLRSESSIDDMNNDQAFAAGIANAMADIGKFLR